MAIPETEVGPKRMENKFFKQKKKPRALQLYEKIHFNIQRFFKNKLIHCYEGYTSA